MVSDFPEFYGQLHIKEFLIGLLKWRVSLKIEIFLRENKSSLSVVSLRDVHGHGGSNYKGCVS